MSFERLSVEIISQILLNLHFEGILTAEAVCKTWKEVIDSDPNIQVQLFRRATDRYVAPTAKSPHRGWGLSEGKGVRFHPAIATASYTLSDTVERVSFYTDRQDGIISLPSLSIAQDQFSIPSVTMICIFAKGMAICADNDDGVKVIDFFRELANASQISDPDVAVDEVWGHPYYEGIDQIQLKNGCAFGTCMFGS